MTDDRGEQADAHPEAARDRALGRGGRHRLAHWREARPARPAPLKRPAARPAPSAAAETGEEPRAVGAAVRRVGRALGVRHQPEHPPVRREDAGDVARRAVGVVDVAEGDAVLALEPVERVGVGEVVAVVVGDRQPDGLAAARSRAVKALSAVATVSGTVAQTNLSPALRISAPGSRPASISTWKPLQTPEHVAAAPRRRPTTARMTGERAAMAPQRR